MCLQTDHSCACSANAVDSFAAEKFNDFEFRAINVSYIGFAWNISTHCVKRLIGLLKVSSAKVDHMGPHAVCRPAGQQGQGTSIYNDMSSSKCARFIGGLHGAR